MPLREEIIKIVEYGTAAPSGDNSQPWRFEVSGDTIKVFNIPDRDNPILNVGQRGSYIAHGALIENMLIASSHMGFSPDLKIFPEGTSSDLTASMTLVRSEPKNEPLFSYIKERATNRRPYKIIPLSEGEREVLLAAGSLISGCELKLVDNRETIKAVSSAMSVAERVFLETKELHKLLFKSVFFDPERNKKGEWGLYVNTLELPLPARVIFRIIDKWPVTRFFNFLGFNKLVSKINASIYEASSAHGAILVEDKDENFIDAGRAFQRVWLEATRMGLAIQPVTGVIFLSQRIESRDGAILSESNQSLVRESAQKIEFAFNTAPSKIIAMLFRIGRAEPPSARSYRKKAEIIYQ